MNVLMIYEGMREGGGVQVHVLTLSKALRNLGIDVLLFPVSPLHSEETDLRLFLALLMQPLLCFVYGISALRFMKETHIDLVHAHGARLPLVLGWLVSKATRTPLVVTMHEAWTRANRLNPLYRKADKVITVSEEIKVVLECYGVDKTRLACIPNMVEVDFSERASINHEGGYKLVFLGRLDPSKTGILMIILDAIPRITQELPATQFWIVGSAGSKYHEVSKKVKEINEALGRKAVYLLGYTKNVTGMIEKADLVIGVGRVALEALALGKPVIVGSAVKGSAFAGGLVTQDNVDEIAESNFTGRDYSQVMNAQQVGKLIVDLLRDYAYRETIGKFGRELIKAKFESGAIASETASVYFECLKKERSVRRSM